MTLTQVNENQVVLISTEEYILNNIPNILQHLRREFDADAKVIDNTVKIVCNLGIKKFEGRVLRKLLVKEAKKVLKEALTITANRWFNSKPL